MGTPYESPIETRELEKLIDRFTYQNGFDVRVVFQDLLRYIVQGLSLPGTPPPTDWRYTKAQDEAFYEMYTVWIQIMDKQIKIHGWYDSFGDLFMALTSKSGQQQKGQFFTPDHVSDLCQRLVMGKDNKIHTIYDPAAGSGRMLLAAKAENPMNYLIAWDIDYTCCLMCVCNFLMNGCVGEVVCIDSLNMDNFRGAWLVNEACYRTGLPSIRWMNEKEYLLYKQSDIPAYVFFLNQERYTSYFRMREMWATISAILKNNPPSNKD